MFSKKVVIYLANSFNNDDATKRTDDIIEDTEDKFAVQTDSKYSYRIPLKNFWDLGKINFLTKTEIKICCTLETELERLIESKRQVVVIGAPDEQIIFLKAPFIQYEQILLTKNESFENGSTKNTVKKPTSFRWDCKNSR